MTEVRTRVSLWVPQHFCFQPIKKKKKKPPAFAASLPAWLVFNRATPSGLEGDLLWVAMCNVRCGSRVGESLRYPLSKGHGAGCSVRDAKRPCCRASWSPGCPDGTGECPPRHAAATGGGLNVDCGMHGVSGPLSFGVAVCPGVGRRAKLALGGRCRLALSDR